MHAMTTRNDMTERLCRIMTGWFEDANGFKLCYWHEANNALWGLLASRHSSIQNLIEPSKVIIFFDWCEHNIQLGQLLAFFLTEY